MKKVSTDVEEFAARIADKEDNPTIHELVQKFPDKTYRELEKYREESRLKKEGVCIVGEARKDRENSTISEKYQDELEPIANSKPIFYTEERIKLKKEIKELEESLANALAIEGSHQKLNGKLRERVTELEEENKKLKDHFEKGIDAARKSGV